jgi:hypothetical protein
MSLSEGTHAKGRADLQTVISKMQEAVLLLAADFDDAGATVVGYRIAAANDVAARAVGLGPAELIDRGLGAIFAADTAVLLHQLCGRALQSDSAVQHFAAAPDPLTDLSRSPTVAVQVARAGDSVLCTWLPGWLTETGGDDRGQEGTTRLSTMDRLELATVLDTLAEVGFGVFSLDLMTGRVIGSNGLYEMFCRGLEARPAEKVDLQCLVESIVAGVDAWQDLLHRGVPMDVEVHLVRQLGGHRVRLTGRVFRGSDGYPAVVRGSCCLLDQ